MQLQFVDEARNLADAECARVRAFMKCLDDANAVHIQNLEDKYRDSLSAARSDFLVTQDELLKVIKGNTKEIEVLEARIKELDAE